MLEIHSGNQESCMNAAPVLFYTQAERRLKCPLLPNRNPSPYPGGGFLLFIILFIVAFLIYNGAIRLNNPYESKYPVTRKDVDVLSYHGDRDQRALSVHDC